MGGDWPLVAMMVRRKCAMPPAPSLCGNGLRQDREVRELLARNAFHGSQARGFIQDWLLLLVLAPAAGDTGEQALDREQLPNEARLQPRQGDLAWVGSRQFVWRKHRSPAAVLDLNAALGRVAERSVAYAVCYLETDQASDDLWLQVASDDQAKVYVNGRQVYRCHLRRSLLALDTVGPVSLERGTNVLVFKIVNEGATGQAACALWTTRACRSRASG